MVFLVEEIESSRQYVLKFYRHDEDKSFQAELNANITLLKSPYTQKAIKFVIENENQTPFIVENSMFKRYSYIILPYCSKGTLIDLLIAANNKKVKLSLDLACYFFK